MRQGFTNVVTPIEKHPAGGIAAMAAAGLLPGAWNGGRGRRIWIVCWLQATEKDERMKRSGAAGAQEQR